MRVLRKGAIREIIRELDGLFLTSHAFDTSFNNDNGEIVRLVYRDNPEFLFIIHQPTRGGIWRTAESPGLSFISIEEYDHRDFHSCRGRISSWVNRIIEELAISATPSQDVFNYLRRNLEEIANNLPNPEEPFSEEEASEWKEKLDGVIQRMKELEKENKIQSGRIAALENEFAQLLQRIGKIPKRTWLKAAGNRFLNFFEEVAKEGAKAFAEATIKGLLLHCKIDLFAFWRM